jgi:hypothetical protein
MASHAGGKERRSKKKMKKKGREGKGGDPEELFEKQERIGKGSFGEVFRGFVFSFVWSCVNLHVTFPQVQPQNKTGGGYQNY